MNELLTDIYVASLEFSRDNRQTVGEKNNYYITLEQLEQILMRLQNV